jgi:hypothetical protein
LQLTVPSSVDRSVAGKLTVTATSRQDIATVERPLAPLPGAKAPPFTIALDGLTPNQALEAPQTLTPQVPEGVALTQVEYLLNDELVAAVTEPPFAFTLDPAGLSSGAQVLSLRATDTRGATGAAEVTFRIPAPAQANPLTNVLPILAILGAVAAVAGGLWLLLRRILAPRGGPGNVERLRPFAPKVDEPMSPPEEWPERPVLTPEPAARILGRVVVMDEAAIREGDLTKIREFLIGSAPITLGAGADCDIRIEDDESIGMEEARLWVQRGHLVYHKLTTLSAMAVEGVSSGWILLENGEDMRLGKYRLLFQGEVPESAFEEEQPSEVQVEQPRPKFMGWSA